VAIAAPTSSMTDIWISYGTTTHPAKVRL